MPDIFDRLGLSTDTPSPFSPPPEEEEDRNDIFSRLRRLSAPQEAPEATTTPTVAPDPVEGVEMASDPNLRRSTARVPEMKRSLSRASSPLQRIMEQVEGQLARAPLVPGQPAPEGPMEQSPEVPRVPAPDVRPLPERLGSAVVRGVEDVNRAALGAVEAAGEDVAGAGRRAQEEGFAFARPLFELVEQAGQELAEIGRRSVPEETPFSKPPGEPQSLPEDVLQALPSFATGIGAGLAGGPGTAMAVLGVQETGGQYLKERSAGKPHEQAVQSAVTYGAASALLERYGVSRVLENAFPGAAKGKALDFTRRFVQGALAEGGTEATQDVASNLTTVITEASRSGMDFDALADVFSEENLRQYGRTGLVSMILGGGTVTAGQALRPGQPPSPSVDSTPQQEAASPAVAPPPSAPTPSAETPPEGGTFSPEAPSHAGQAGESPEAIARVSRVERTFRVTRSGEILPIPNTVDAVDVRVNPGEAKVRLTAGGDFDIEQGGQGTVAQRAAISRLREGQVPEAPPSRVREGEAEVFELDVGEGLPSESASVAEPEAAPSVVERLPAAQDEAGFVRRPDRSLLRDVKNAIDRVIKPQGNLPVSAWKLKLQKDHNLGAHEKGLEFRLRELNRKIRKYEGPLTKRQLTRYLGDALRGTVPLDISSETAGFDETQIERIARQREIPVEQVRSEFELVGRREAGGLGQAPEFAPLVAKLRMDIDAVTRSLRREGLLDDAAARDLERSAGLYVHRSYEAFRGKSKAHLRKVEASPLWNRAKQLVAEEHPDFTNEEVDGFLREFIERGDRPTLPGNIPEGALNRSTLFQRKGVRDLERLLLGERRDVRSLAMDTLIGQVSLLEHHRFLKALRKDGLNKYLFERPRGRYYRNIEETVTPLPILGREGKPETIYRKATHRRYGELTASGRPGGQALHTTPEILRELEEATPHVSEWPLWLKLWSLGNFAIKTNLTVLSPTTTGRNYLSNTLAALANGYSPWGGGVRAGKDVVFRDIANSSDDDVRAMYQKFIRLGIMDQGSDYGDLRRLGAFADLMRVEQDPGARPVTWAKTFLRKAGQIYQHGDNFWKILGWSQERARLAEAHPNWNEQQLDEGAADIVRRVLQNYAELPRAARAISANPVVAPFFSFTWAMFRNVKETSIQAAHEVQSDNPATRRVGYRRAAGLISALALPEMVTFALRYMSNTDDEDDQALREFVYPWDRGSNLGIVSKKPGEYVYFNWGFMDYFSRLKEPVRLVLQAAGEDRDAADVTGDIFADYGEEVLLGAMVDVARGETADGYSVWLEKDSLTDRVAKSLDHLWSTGRPGVARNVENLADATQGEKNRKLWIELVALAGPRFTAVNVRERLDRYGAGFSRNLGEATRVYSQFSNRTQDPGGRDLVRGYRRANEERQRLLRDLSRKIEAGVVSGLSVMEVEQILLDGGVPQKYIDMALGGGFEPVDYARGAHWEKYQAELESAAQEAER